jgi:putative membrane protein
MPVDVALGFGLGMFVSSRWPGLRRVLTTPTQRKKNVLSAARSTFVELGVSRTRGRNGVLVYVSLIERAVSVVADIGVDTKALGPAWVDALAALDSAVDRCDFDAFKTALRQIAPPLASVMPRSEDDIDELANNLGDP